MTEGFEHPTVEQITADLEAGQAAAPEAPAPEPQGEAASPASEAVAPAAGDTPAPAAAPAPAEPTPLELTDTTLVRDPFDQKVKPWGDIKQERMLRADYSRKMHAVGEMRREAEAVKLKYEAEARQAELKAKFAALPPLAEDDPYAMHQKALREQLESMSEQQRALHERAQQDAQERMEYAKQAELAASRVALAAEERRLAEAYGFKDDLAGEIAVVEREYWYRKQTDPSVTLDGVAKERRAMIDKVVAAGIGQFKEKHRVGSAPAGAAAPAVGTGTAVLTPGSEGFEDKFREEFLAAVTRR